MNFPKKGEPFSGLLRRYKKRGYPKIELMPSSTTGQYVPENVLDFENVNSHWASDRKEGLNAQFVVKVVSGVFRITDYSIRSHTTDTFYMQAWSLEGSGDNKNYFKIHNKAKNSDLINSKIGQYSVNSEMNYYRYFRIKQTMKTPNNDNNSRISGLDFYGHFLPFQLNSCKMQGRTKNNLLSLVFLIYSS